MITKCANPACAREFHYLHDGRLFHFEVKNACRPCQDVPAAICEQQPRRAAVFFWLCRECASQFTLRFDPGSGLRVVPISGQAAGASSPLARGATAGLELREVRQEDV